MYRATTPTHTFTLPMDTSNCLEILVTYKQGNVQLDKHYQDNIIPDGMTLDGADVSVRLTQQETLMFKRDEVSAQVRVLTTQNQAMASQKFKIRVHDVLNEDILS